MTSSRSPRRSACRRWRSGDARSSSAWRSSSTMAASRKVFYPVFPPDRNAADVLAWLRRTGDDVGHTQRRRTAAERVISGRTSKSPDVALPSTDGGETSIGAMFPVCRSSLSTPGPDARAAPIRPIGTSSPAPTARRRRRKDFAISIPSSPRKAQECFGLSSQDSGHQREFALRMRLPFPLLSDARVAFRRALAAARFETGGETYLKRLTSSCSRGRLIKVFYPVHPPDYTPARCWRGCAVSNSTD